MSEIEQLRAELARLQGRLDELEHAQMDQPVPRRHMLRALGGVAAGAAVGGLAFAKPTAAADGDPVLLGENNLYSTRTLVGTATSNIEPTTGLGGLFGVTDNALGAHKLFNDVDGFGATYGTDVVLPLLRNSVLTGTASDTSAEVGVTGTGLTGVTAVGSGTGLAASGVNFGAVIESQNTGLAASGVNIGAVIESPGTGATIEGVGFGVISQATGTGGIGAKLGGDVPLKLGGSSAPGSAVGGHFKFHSGTLYFGVGLGTDKWRRLASTDSAGVFVPVTPFRVYDSRFTAGRLDTGENATIDCSDSINVNTGELTTADALPSDARAIAYTVTAVDTSGGGYLAVTPATATEVTASTINWSSPNTLANSSIVGISNRQVKVFCGGGPGTAADFIIDIVGYYH